MNAPFSARLSPSSDASNWHAELDLRVESRGARSTLAHCRHNGPLRVQKALYPEGGDVCQILILHPPAGIAGGDHLDIALEVGSDAHAQATTPGAGKWYRSKGPQAFQDIELRVAAGGRLEWLPQEAIVFDQAQANTTTIMTLEEGAHMIGWDIVCLGRAGSGERFEAGNYRQRLRLQRPDGTPLWQEAMHLGGADAAMQSPTGLGGATVFGTLWLAGIGPDAALVEALRQLTITDGTCGVSALPHVTLVRAVAHSAESLRRYLEAAWALARPIVLQRAAVSPRIWRT